MELSPKQSGKPDSHIYSAAVSADRPASDYTARVVPSRDGVAVPLEAARVVWQR
jgi:starch phosphorylase